MVLHVTCDFGFTVDSVEPTASVSFHLHLSSVSPTPSDN